MVNKSELAAESADVMMAALITDGKALMPAVSMAMT